MVTAMAAGCPDASMENAAILATSGDGWTIKGETMEGSCLAILVSTVSAQEPGIELPATAFVSGSRARVDIAARAHSTSRSVSGSSPWVLIMSTSASATLA